MRSAVGELAGRTIVNRPVAIGVVLLLAIEGLLAVLGLFVPVEPLLRGWLVAFAIWSPVPIGSMILLLIHCLTGGKWGQAAAPILRPAAALTPVVALAFVPVLVGLRHIYPWAADPSAIHGVDDDPPAVATAKRHLERPFAGGRLVLRFPVHAERAGVAHERLGLHVRAARPGSQALPGDDPRGRRRHRRRLAADGQQRHRRNRQDEDASHGLLVPGRRLFIPGRQPCGRACILDPDSHFAEFIQAEDSPGLILIPSRVSIGEAIDGLLIAWLSWTPEEMRNQIRWLPR